MLKHRASVRWAWGSGASRKRGPKKFIPYTITSNNGAYRTAAATEQTTFANTWGAGGYGYSETKFEASPLNRPIEQGNIR
jgi:hypothetical protein